MLLPAEGPGTSLPCAICCHATSRAKRRREGLQCPMLQGWPPKRCRTCRPSREVPMFPLPAAAAGTYETLFSFADVLIAAPMLGILIAGLGRRSKWPPRISGNGHSPTFPKEMERPSSRQNRVPPALRCSAFLPSSARGSHKNQRAPPGRLSHTSGQVCPGCGISDIREAIALLPPEGMTWLLKRASRACLRRAEACRQPIREVMKRRRSIGTARMPTTSCPSLPQQCHVPPLRWFSRIPLRE